MEQNLCLDKIFHDSDQLLEASDKSLSTLIIYNFSENFRKNLLSYTILVKISEKICLTLCFYIDFIKIL